MQSGTTGINSVRIYNPIKQGFDHDANGEFVNLAFETGAGGSASAGTRCSIREYSRPSLGTCLDVAISTDEVWPSTVDMPNGS